MPRKKNEVEPKTPYPLGRMPSPFDPRDYNLKTFIPPTALKKAEIKEMVWDFPSDSLNQGETPHCVGFSMASFGINLPTNTPHVDQDGHDYYYQCKIIDNQPNMENGSYVRSAAKVLKNQGKIDAYAFAPDMETIKWWLLNKGPLIVGTLWTQDMFYPDEYNIIVPTGKAMGGHAYLLNEWTIDNFIGLQNSWGSEWGSNGKAYISAVNFEKIFNFDGEAMTAVELGTPTPPSEKNCILMEIFKALFEALFKS